MLKATYRIKGTFSLKHPNDGHLMARSITHTSRSTIRGALLAAAFKYKGATWVEEHFYQIKEAMVLPQLLTEYSKQQEKRTRISTTAIEYGLGTSDEKKEKIKPKTMRDVESLTTVGIREYVQADTLTFYIDETIDDVVELLSNITRLGDSESLVELVCIERTNQLNDALVTSAGYDYTKQYVYDWDWEHKTTLEQVNAYGEKYGRKSQEIRCHAQSLSL